MACELEGFQDVYMSGDMARPWEPEESASTNSESCASVKVPVGYELVRTEVYSVLQQELGRLALQADCQDALLE